LAVELLRALLVLFAMWPSAVAGATADDRAGVFEIQCKKCLVHCRTQNLLTLRPRLRAQGREVSVRQVHNYKNEGSV
jgi:hypothetical protein